ncbi:hypothetical protein [Parabacteroides sp. FAFU027]|uniref:hypothetical protein n=1 Tax=Parabacteroides sp. FAFU027 TaxID=2922715 RepID=UPI001FAEE57F|nr:hypothetical protein [Parabacteroides sp. FAFU027]
MTTLFDNIFSLWKWAIIPSFVLAIIGFGIMWYVRNYEVENGKKKMKIGVILFAQVFIVFASIFLLRWIIEIRVRDEIKELANNSKIEINSSSVNKEVCCQLTRDIQNIFDDLGNHSSPTDTFLITILSQKQTVSLRFCRDSENDSIYWIYWDKYKTTDDNCFGKVSTNCLKNYPSFKRFSNRTPDRF